MKDQSTPTPKRSTIQLDLEKQYDVIENLSGRLAHLANILQPVSSAKPTSEVAEEVATEPDATRSEISQMINRRTELINKLLININYLINSIEL